MKLAISIIIYLLSLNVYSQKPIEAVQTSIHGNSYFSIINESNKKALIFLHGGVNNPYFDQAVDKIDFNVLIENNLAFVKQLTAEGFDLIVPITNDRFNWLEKHAKSFAILKEILKQSNKDYEAVFISGFSDGGTGSYKMFYDEPDFFNGLVVFNGYPQHTNFYQSVNYKSIVNKKVLFFSTDKDKVIPYEFLLTEYCQQKKTNPNTFFYLASGNHSFTSYNESDIAEVLDILTNKNQNKKTEPIQGFIKNDRLIRRYPFRKKIVRKYNFGKEVYEANIEQHKNK